MCSSDLDGVDNDCDGVVDNGTPQSMETGRFCDIDKAQDRLAVDARQPVKPLEVADPSDDETVIFTSVWVRNDKGELQQGIVADCRWYNGRFDIVDRAKEIDFTDQEEAWEELDSRQVLSSR